MKILVVDDDRRMRELVSYNLRLDGHDVLLAGSGAEGLALALEHVPDLILLDVMMYAMDGLEVLRALRRDERTREIPVFMLSAKGQLADMDRALRLGADDYITKPFDPEKLGRLVAAKLQRRVTTG